MFSSVLKVKVLVYIALCNN